MQKGRAIPLLYELEKGVHLTLFECEIVESGFLLIEKNLKLLPKEVVERLNINQKVLSSDR